MPVVELVAHRVRLPLRRPVRHAGAERDSSESLVVACRLNDGTIGFGEGVPRPYVTGESPEESLAQFRRTDWGTQIAGVDPADWPAVVALADRIAPAVAGPDARGIAGNSLRAAVELALLDAMGQRFGQPLSSAAMHVQEAASAAGLLASPESVRSMRVRYSAAITAEGAWRERISAAKFRLYGFAHCKVKVGMPGADDALRLRRVRWLVGRRMDLRVDANEAWPAEQAVARIAGLTPAGISCVEQPVRHAEVESLAEIRRQIAVPIMLDESLCGPFDAQRAIAGGWCDRFNLRISKCGGWLACLRLAAMARQAGLPCQLGCHPGESGILSAAGRHFAQAVAGLCYLEGSYDRHLLVERLTREDLTFGPGGWASALAGPGLGVRVDCAALERVTLESHAIRCD